MRISEFIAIARRLTIQLHRSPCSSHFFSKYSKFPVHIKVELYHAACHGITTVYSKLNEGENKDGGKNNKTSVSDVSTKEGGTLPYGGV